MIDENKLYQIILNEFETHNECFLKLTQREIDILRLLANGVHSKGIAAALNISEHTVKTHRKNINKKTKIKNSRHLVLFALAFDLIESYHPEN